MLGEPEFFAPRAPFTGTETAPQTETATAASTAEKAITQNSTSGAIYEFVAAGFVHVAFGKTGMGAATTADWLVTTTPRRIWIDPAIITHIRTIRNGAADVIVSFQRVR
jgi:hypothetical protein